MRQVIARPEAMTADEKIVAARVVLSSGGWIPTKDPELAVHPALHWPWPISDALQLERDAAAGDSGALLLLERMP